MPSINMIAARRSEKKRLERTVRIALLVIVGELAVGLCVFGFMTAKVHASSKAVSRLDTELQRLQPTVDKIHSYENEIKVLEPRLDLLSESREQTLLWYSILRNLSKSMPENTWLTSLSSTIPSGDSKVQAPPMVNISGISVSQRLVGETMLRLNEFPEFSKVDLTFTQKGGTQDLDTLRFQIVANVKGNERKEAQKDAAN